MSRVRLRRARLSRWGWFVALWLASVVTLAVVAAVLRALIL